MNILQKIFADHYEEIKYTLQRKFTPGFIISSDPWIVF